MAHNIKWLMYHFTYIKYYFILVFRVHTFPKLLSAICRIFLLLHSRIFHIYISTIIRYIMRNEEKNKKDCPFLQLICFIAIGPHEILHCRYYLRIKIMQCANYILYMLKGEKKLFISPPE